MAKIEKAIEKIDTVALAVESRVKVELLNARIGTDNIFHSLGVTTFTDGVAIVERKIATELVNAGVIKLVK